MHISRQNGFTLVEIAIVVAIIGLLAVVAVPAVLQAGNDTRARRFAREIKHAGHAFVRYAMEHGQYPADKNPSQMPIEMTEYLKGFPWTATTVIGGHWDWDYEQFGTRAGVSVHQPDWNDDKMAEIDELIDDGNLSTGQFRKRSAGYIYVLEEL